MILPFFASFILLCLVVHRAISRDTRLTKHSEEAFWQRENTANETRRKSLDSLDFIRFCTLDISPEKLLDTASQDLLFEHTHVGILLDRLKTLEKSRIVNLNYITNTELKAAYGVANLTLLTEYDQNYTDLITTLQEYASLLAQNGYLLPALTVLDFAFLAKTDICASYSLAAWIYQEQGHQEKIQGLIQKAESLNSPRKNAIICTLKQGNYSFGH